MPIIITALHMPTQEVIRGDHSIAWLEDYIATNLSVFKKGGISCVKLQDQFRTSKKASPEIIALMGSIGSFARHEFPELRFGIIIEAHDPCAALAVANACDAEFVRIKGFVGVMAKADGIVEGCGSEAFSYRDYLGRKDIALFADVHDRTGFPLSNEPITFAAGWAEYHGADAFVLTGHNFDNSIQIIRDVREGGVSVPLVIGGGATAKNIKEILSVADGVILSSSLKLDNAKEDDLLQWDQEKIITFMDAAQG